MFSLVLSLYRCVFPLTHTFLSQVASVLFFIDRTLKTHSLESRIELDNVL